MRGDKPVVAVLGQFQCGKSTLVNCLLGGEYAIKGQGTATTACNIRYAFGDLPELAVELPSGAVRREPFTPAALQVAMASAGAIASITVSAYSPFLETLDLVDSPGWGAKDGDNASASAAVEAADAFVYVFRKTVDQEADVPFLRAIARSGKPLFAVLNCLDSRPPASAEAQAVCAEIDAKLRSAGLADALFPLATSWQNKRRDAASPCRATLAVNLLWAEFALRCADAAELARIDRKMAAFADSDAPDRGAILAQSGLLHLRSALVTKTALAAKLPRSQPLELMDRCLESLRNELLEAFNAGEGAGKESAKCP